MTTTYTIDIPANILIALAKHCALKDDRPLTQYVFFEIPSGREPIAFATNGVAAAYHKLQVPSDFPRENDVVLYVRAGILKMLKKDKNGFVKLTWKIGEGENTVEVAQNGLTTKQINSNVIFPENVRRLCVFSEEYAGQPAHFDGAQIAQFAPIADLLGAKLFLIHPNGEAAGVVSYYKRDNFFSLLYPLRAHALPKQSDISWVNAQ